MTSRVLFVCLGNICRSPAAEAVFRNLALSAELKVIADSAGTGDWHVGNAPYGPMQSAARQRGFELSKLRARQFRLQDFSEFDLILAMDRENVAAIEALRPRGNDTPVRLFLDYLPEAGIDEVPDPYFTRDFDQALDLVEAASAGLIAQLQ